MLETMGMQSLYGVPTYEMVLSTSNAIEVANTKHEMVSTIPTENGILVPS
jgi:hypothetical protein